MNTCSKCNLPFEPSPLFPDAQECFNCHQGMPLIEKLEAEIARLKAQQSKLHKESYTLLTSIMQSKDAAEKEKMTGDRRHRICAYNRVFNRRQKAEVMLWKAESADGECQWCFKPSATYIHDIPELRGDEEVYNCAILCEACYQKAIQEKHVELADRGWVK